MPKETANRWSRMGWSTQSKAALRSRNPRIETIPASAAMIMSEVTLRRAVSVESDFRYADWHSGSRFAASRCNNTMINSNGLRTEPWCNCWVIYRNEISYLSGSGGWALAKSSVFSRDLKDASEMLGCCSSGAKEFQHFGPETAKLRGPIRTVRVQGTVLFPGHELCEWFDLTSNHHEQQIAGDNCKASRGTWCAVCNP